MAAIVHRNICAEYWLEVQGSKWATSPKVIKNNQTNIILDSQIQGDKMEVAN